MNVNTSPPDYNTVRGPPPLPPPPPSPPSLALTAASSTKGLDRVLLERNLEKLLSEKGSSNHSSSSEHLPLEGDLNRILGLNECPKNLCFESHIEKLSLKEDAGNLSNLNLSRVVVNNGGTLGVLKPEVKKLFLDIDNCDSGISDLRKDLRLMLTGNEGCEERPEKKLNHEEVESMTEQGRCQEIVRRAEPSTSLEWRAQENESPHDSGHASSMPELAVQPPTPSSPQRKNVRFKGAPLELEERKIPRSRSYSGRPDSRHDHDDTESYCSTCSSSSSSDDMSAYQLPPRRAYGGVRISYVPNDAFAIARQRQQTSSMKSPSKKTVDDKNCVIS